jgi:hypothetical protein
MSGAAGGVGFQNNLGIGQPGQVGGTHEADNHEHRKTAHLHKKRHAKDPNEVAQDEDHLRQLREQAAANAAGVQPNVVHHANAIAFNNTPQATTPV